ncbi:MAG: Zn-ribbon-containing protein [Clostridiales bacterium]|jgi:predicted  nucleic acid-binding Zn ribbon protein|nr:Zn-ribbon-containing protein [Clostridiales bacterium]
MKYYKLSFRAKKDDFDRDADVYLVEEYLGCLYKNGQIVDYDGMFVKDGFVYCHATLPEADALSRTNDNKYVAEGRDKVGQIFEIGLEEPLGDDWHLDLEACRCESPSRYMLDCGPCHDDSPITCCDCMSPIPLYRLPKIFGEEEFYTLREFERECKAIGELWLSGLNDKFTFKQRNDPSSQLAKKGRKICKAFEKATGKPFYYFLSFDYWSFFYDKKDNCQEHPAPKECPSCGKNWEVKKGESVVGYRCDACRLLSQKNRDLQAEE